MKKLNWTENGKRYRYIYDYDTLLTVNLFKFYSVFSFFRTLFTNVRQKVKAVVKIQMSENIKYQSISVLIQLLNLNEYFE